ncbi:MAG: glycine zipper domain-containing protein [Myxococcota bacterium]
MAEIRANIERARRQISEGFTDIQTNVEESLDWKGWVEDNPWKTVGIAFGVGFFMGLR